MFQSLSSTLEFLWATERVFLEKQRSAPGPCFQILVESELLVYFCYFVCIILVPLCSLLFLLVFHIWSLSMHCILLIKRQKSLHQAIGGQNARVSTRQHICHIRGVIFFNKYRNSTSKFNTFNSCTLLLSDCVFHTNFLNLDILKSI